MSTPKMAIFDHTSPKILHKFRSVHPSIYPSKLSCFQNGFFPSLPSIFLLKLHFSHHHNTIKTHSRQLSNQTSLFFQYQKTKPHIFFITNIPLGYLNGQVPFVVHLNGQFLWVTCEQSYLSSTYNAPLCHSTQCDGEPTPLTATHANQPHDSPSGHG